MVKNFLVYRYTGIPVYASVLVKIQISFLHPKPPRATAGEILARDVVKEKDIIIIIIIIEDGIRWNVKKRPNSFVRFT